MIGGDDGTRTSRRRASSLGIAVALGALCLGCAHQPASVAPPTAQGVAPAPVAATPSSPVPGPSVPVAALTGAAGRQLWTRDGRPGDRAVTTGDAVVALEAPGSSAPTATLVPAPTGPAAAAGAPSAAPSPAVSVPPYRLVFLDGASGRTRATHDLGGADASRPPPGPLMAKAYRRAPVAAVSVPDPSAPSSSIEEAYEPAGRRVWKSPDAGLRLFGDEGEYTTADRRTKPQVGGPLTPIQKLQTLSGADVVAFGPQSGEQVTFVHGGTAVVVRGQEFRVATVTRRSRTLWSSARAAPHGFTGGTPIAVLGDRLLVQWNGASSHLLALYDLASGRQAWRGESLTGQVTPGAVVEDADSHVAVVGSDGTGPTLGVDVRTGKIAWRIAGSQNVRPVAGGRGRVYGANGDTALAVDARTGRITTLGTHVEIVGLTGDGVLVLRGATSPGTGRIWAFRPPSAGP